MQDNAERARMLAMALRWLTASDKIAIEFLKQFGVSLMKGKNPNMTPEFNRYFRTCRAITDSTLT